MKVMIWDKKASEFITCRNVTDVYGGDNFIAIYRKHKRTEYSTEHYDLDFILKNQSL